VQFGPPWKCEVPILGVHSKTSRIRHTRRDEGLPARGKTKQVKKKNVQDVE
jgi:hypothetical protein